ncbi:MAG: hypothetical protein ACW99Q_27475 [Candidatus Kariarchaeaceae archaeon]|jgi:ribosomal protein S25
MSERTIVKKKKKWGKIFEYEPIVRTSVLTKELADEIGKEIAKANGLTPQSLAQKFRIKVSLAKEILSKMAEKGDIKLVHSNGKNQIYAK